MELGTYIFAAFSGIFGFDRPAHLGAWSSNLNDDANSQGKFVLNSNLEGASSSDGSALRSYAERRKFDFNAARLLFCHARYHTSFNSMRTRVWVSCCVFRKLLRTSSRTGGKIRTYG